MDTRTVAVIIIVGLILLTGIAVWAYRRRRSARLRSRFGPEYDHVLNDMASRRRAEAELEARLLRVSALHIRELDAKKRAQLAESWQPIQTRFADDPKGAVSAADRLVTEAMQARGYPVGSLDQSVNDMSVHHAHVIDDYRRAREITARADLGQVGTEDLVIIITYPIAPR